LERRKYKNRNGQKERPCDGSKEGDDTGARAEGDQDERIADETEERGDEESEREGQKKINKENRTPWSRQCGRRIRNDHQWGERRGWARTNHTLYTHTNPMQCATQLV
jgi:hypothetical protein